MILYIYIYMYIDRYTHILHTYEYMCIHIDHTYHHYYYYYIIS